jgi:hypothetical protein
MTIKYNAGELVLDLHDMLQSVDAESKIKMVESLSCDDDILKHVTAQIIDRWTENVCSAGSSYIASPTARNGLDWAWREVAKKSSDVAKREIERLEYALRKKNEEYLNVVNEYHALQDKHRRP